MDLILCIVICFLSLISVFIIVCLVLLKNKNPSIKLVVARYNEELDWMNIAPFKYHNAIIYEKGPYPIKCKNKKWKQEQIPNVGREYHTYLHFICTNYNNLPDIVVFIPGSVLAPHKFNKIMELFNSLNSTEKVDMLFEKERGKDLKNYLYLFTHENYSSTNVQNNQLNPESSLEPAVIKPFGKWYENYIGEKPIPEVWYGGVGVATRERIRKNPLYFYVGLMNQLSVSSNPEVGHYMERSWFAIFS